MAASSNGNCYICGVELGKVAMKNHILKEHSEKGGEQECALLKVEGAANKNYWLFIEVPTHVTLTVVDEFLRKIWLECCGHMSMFHTTLREEIGMTRKLNYFSRGDKVFHSYDFGSTTETLITVVGTISRKPQKKDVRLLARNVPPQYKCAECDKPANYISTELMYYSDNPFYCKKCGKKHEDEEDLLPITNSPRMGECAYCGEQDNFTFVPL